MMIYTELTKRFFGINLYGDFYDLERLYKVIHHCAEGYEENSSARKHLHYVAYEVRHAKQGERIRKILEIDGISRNTYFGTSFALPYYLLFINLMQNSYANERRLWQTTAIWELTADLQETSLLSGSMDFVRSVDYWAFNSLLNQPRLIPDQNLLSPTIDKDYLTVMADFATIKFKSLLPENRLSKLSTVMNYMHPWTDDHKEGVDELRRMGISLQQGSHLEFEMLDIENW